MTSIDLYDAKQVEARQFHFVFVLDESGSMAGQPFAELQAAYQNFIAKRTNDQGMVTMFQLSCLLMVHAP